MVDPKPLLKGLPAAFGSANAGVRDKAKEICIQLAAYVGAASVASHLYEKMPPAMKKDVEAAVAALPPGKKKPERFTRKEQEAMAAAAGVEPEPMDIDDDGADGVGADAGAAPEEQVCFLAVGVCVRARVCMCVCAVGARGGTCYCWVHREFGLARQLCPPLFGGCICRNARAWGRTSTVPGVDAHGGHWLPSRTRMTSRRPSPSTSYVRCKRRC